MYVQASTLGALEALLEFFKANSVPYSGIRVGPVVKRDVMKAAAMLEHDPMYAVILAFDVKVEKDAQELADKVRPDRLFKLPLDITMLIRRLMDTLFCKICPVYHLPFLEGT